MTYNCSAIWLSQCLGIKLSVAEKLILGEKHPKPKLAQRIADVLRLSFAEVYCK